MPAKTLVAVGASAGGVEALRSLVGGLPAGLDAAVLVVLHIPRMSPSALPNILRRTGPLPVKHAADGEALASGQIYVAPPDHHLLVIDDQVTLSRGPSENGHRPAVDPMFRSAARAYGPRMVAVVLSGSGDDGTAGAVAVVEAGGYVVVQDPDDALHSPMPRSVVDRVPAARVVPSAELSKVVADLVKSTTESIADDPPPPEQNPPAPEQNSSLPTLEAAMANMEDLTTEDLPARPSGFACPSCNGVLFELAGEPSPRFRCRVGHAWSPRSLLDEQTDGLEGALWMALRTLEEKAALCRRMAESATGRGAKRTTERYLSLEEDAEEAARHIRKLIARLGVLGQRAADLEGAS